MPLKHAILGLLNYMDMTGYDMNRYFHSSIAFFWHAQTSQIYKELNVMTEKNWVDSEIIYQSDKPNRKVFHITEEGKIELHRWMSDADLSEIMKYKNPLLIKLFFSNDRNIDQTMRLLEKYKQECDAVYKRLDEESAHLISEFEGKVMETSNHSMDNDSFYWKLTMSYGLMYYKNEITWANWCMEKLKERI